MAEVNEKVMAFVEEALRENPELRSSELFERAKAIDPSVGSLSSRQFHAQYPLQVHRRMAPPKPRGARRRRRAGRRGETNGTQRVAVRSVLEKFAKDLTASTEPHNLVVVMSNIDTYVEEIVQGAN